MDSDALLKHRTNEGTKAYIDGSVSNGRWSFFITGASHTPVSQQDAVWDRKIRRFVDCTDSQLSIFSFNREKNYIKNCNILSKATPLQLTSPCF